ncbi:hypothetical protein KY338_06390 [Candidatus Woesearchaeota archaeon]|nr:hypothetical protein [Candidatus Woesearchaeota archaeon]MBW3005508.1 hypothetical protein [Candidatus Woesearchaeota archaeon]
MKTKFFFLLFILLALVLSGCEKAECELDSDCLKPHFTGACLDGKCVYSPIPGECGNGICDESETKCTCPADCGICAGPSGPFELVCVGDLCLEGIPDSKVKPQISTEELSAGGDKIRLTTEYNQPFNVLKDTFNIKISLSTPTDRNADRKISKITLVGEIDRQTIPLAEVNLNRPLWPGSEISAELIVDFPTAEKQGEVSNLELQITYDYLTGTTTMAPKSVVVKNRYGRVTFNWVKPSTLYPCPESCDDGNAGTQDICDASTKFFCEHRPIPGVCGNYVCDANENPCTCPVDCGPCADGGTYITFACINNACVAQLKGGISQESQSLFDDRKIGAFHLQNNYDYPDPFNVAENKLGLDFNMYDKNEDVKDVKITTIRVFEGTNELASADPNLALPDTGSTGLVEITIPPQAQPEIAKSLNLKVWFEYKQAGDLKKSSYSKPLGKITLLSPGVPK